ncbi:MAG: hypothetical protein DRI44_00990 [Chlamydiae bacterium]|nr:MAG: hypothetical protein DRI44_00990 [Chlamydiota bacterium]
MIALAEKVYEDAPDLPTENKIRLIDRLSHSTNLPTQTDIDEAWSKEVEARSLNLGNGTSKLI